MNRWNQDYRGDWYVCDDGRWVKFCDAKAIIDSLLTEIQILRDANARLGVEGMEDDYNIQHPSI